MDLSPVLPFLTNASPEALLVFNLALCAGARFLGPAKKSSSEETFAAWSGGAFWGAVLVFLQFKASHFEAGWFVLEARFIAVGVVTAIAAGWATRVALVGREPGIPALYLAFALVAAALFGHVEATVDNSSSVAVTCGALALGCGVFSGLLARSGSPRTLRDGDRASGGH